ncbi:hypothetical protein D6C94_08476 [Aureobasidium pullulans]|uniref:Extracellular serine-rich protein n=1 Tax=Aureobasidium pullulans TaxID=5580 RepID=A0AB38LMY2_AURPU|nr:hypothetical protein D6C94_08476 [Aureobasidium pullulans]
MRIPISDRCHLARAASTLVVGVSIFSALVSGQVSNITGGTTVANTILIFARDQPSSYSATSGLSGYGIPFQLQLVPQAGITLPTLNSSATQGNFGGFIILGEVSYDYGGNNWASALTADQFQQLYAYQSAFGARMVRIDVYPGPAFGVTPTIPGAGCCAAGVEQLLSFTNTSGFPTANLKQGATISTQGIWHYPATITDPDNVWEVAGLAASSEGTFSNPSSAAVIHQAGKRQEMVWFSSWATNWALTSNYLQHAYIAWLTRGLTVGYRRIYLSTQVDDVHLNTALYQPSNALFRLRPADLQAIADWTPQLNSRLPAGSNYFMELGHNGNGNIVAGITYENTTTCKPDPAIIYTGDMSSTPLEYQKPLGTGIDIWPTTPTLFTWSKACCLIDPLFKWLSTPENLNAFAHVSHTFTHESLNNATYNDTFKEITFNQAWANTTGINKATRWSPGGLIPPAITGMHNGDAIRAWMTNGITSAVGDNTRSVLMNQQNEFWPLISTVASNGYDGLEIIPRWATTIFFNCDLPDCTTAEWVNTSGGKGGFTQLLNDARTTNVRHLMGLHHDPFMFHQANLRNADVNSTTIGSITGQFSLIQIWTEVVTQEMSRLTNWPIISLKHDDIGIDFMNRMARDKCNPNLSYQYSADGKSVTSVTVTANGNSCSAPIPVTLPVGATSNAPGLVRETIGSDPLVIWVPLTGSPVTLNLASPVSLL